MHIHLLFLPVPQCINHVTLMTLYLICYVSSLLKPFHSQGSGLVIYYRRQLDSDVRMAFGAPDDLTSSVGRVAKLISTERADKRSPNRLDRNLPADRYLDRAFHRLSPPYQSGLPKIADTITGHKSDKD